MKNIKAAGEAAKTKKTTSEPENFRSALVSTSTATKIADLAERHSLPPAVIAGTIAEIGSEFLGDGGFAEAANVDSASLYWRLITRFDFPRAQTSVPILITENLADETERLGKGMNRKREELLGQFIEMGIHLFNKRDVIYLALGNLESALFHHKAVLLRQEYEGSPDALELMKPSPKAPPAFVAFEKILAAKG